jgi:hypothetical protein
MALSPDRMADLEDIRALSARYARGLDRFAMDELLEPFAGDAVFDARPMGLDQYKGADARWWRHQRFWNPALSGVPEGALMFGRIGAGRDRSGLVACRATTDRSCSAAIGDGLELRALRSR